jgi:deoxyribodipyrimidine photolyase-related protein
VIDRVMARAGRIPMNSLEGFIRQVIGWREFMHGIYQHRGVEIRNGNFWGFDRPLPSSFYDGTTGIPPVDRVIRQLLDDGYCHHIERLMVLGNFMLLCRIKPDDVYRWFMEMFVDSYDWVMVPNVYGMSQFADGGTFTTKPYISGSNYILKMSDEPKGEWCQIWDGAVLELHRRPHTIFPQEPTALDDGENLGENAGFQTRITSSDRSRVSQEALTSSRS